MKKLKKLWTIVGTIPLIITPLTAVSFASNFAVNKRDEVNQVTVHQTVNKIKEHAFGYHEGGINQGGTGQYHFKLTQTLNGNITVLSDKYYWCWVDDHDDDGGVNASWSFAGDQGQEILFDENAKYSISVEGHYISGNQHDMGDSVSPTFSPIELSDSPIGQESYEWLPRTEIFSPSAFDELKTEISGQAFNDSTNLFDNSAVKMPKSFHLNKIGFSFYHFFPDSAGYDNTRMSIDDWKNSYGAGATHPMPSWDFSTKVDVTIVILD